MRSYKARTWQDGRRNDAVLTALSSVTFADVLRRIRRLRFIGGFRPILKIHSVVTNKFHSASKTRFQTDPADSSARCAQKQLSRRFPFFGSACTWFSVSLLSSGQIEGHLKNQPGVEKVCTSTALCEVVAKLRSVMRKADKAKRKDK